MCKGLGNEPQVDIERALNEDYSSDPETILRHMLCHSQPAHLSPDKDVNDVMATPTIERHRTAITRTALSRPVRLALEDGLITQETSVFDYGCGRGTDLLHLRQQEIPCEGWDPAYFPDNERTPADIVNLGYVVNVIENPRERTEALQQAWELTRKVLIVSARLTLEAAFATLTPHTDGGITRSGTFQKFFEQQELREWTDTVLGASSVPAGPGIFYVFRDSQRRQSFAAARYRRQLTVPRQRLSEVLFEQHRDILEPLIGFLTARGRLPDASELPEAEHICTTLGSLKRAYGVIRRVTGAEAWNTIRAERQQDILLYIALSRFEGRPRFTQLPRALQRDVRAFFSSYSRACSLADDLLFSAGDRVAVEQACRRASVGKLTRQALYVHESALSQLPPILRAFEGCARAYIGVVEGANIIKLHRDQPQVSYLSYPDFERDPHPALASSLVVPLQTFKIRYRTYRDSPNPPILHRKETFLPTDHPLHEKFSRLTRQEEKKGLYEKPELIGTREGWQVALTARGLRLAGHRLLRKTTH